MPKKKTTSPVSAKPAARKNSPAAQRNLWLICLLIVASIIFFGYIFAQNAPQTEAAGKGKESKLKERKIDPGKNKNEPGKQQRDGNGKQQSK